MFESITKRQQQRQLAAALQMMKPYVLIPVRGKILWWHWSQIAEAEAAGLLPQHDGLPVLMTKEECAAMNGGKLPDYWGEMPYAWRTENQKQMFHANYPELFERSKIRSGIDEAKAAEPKSG